MNFDLHTLMLAKQLMGLSDQVKGANSPNFDPNQSMKFMSLFQQLAAQTTTAQQQQLAHESERRAQQDDMTRLLQEQIRELQLQLEKSELEKREQEEKDGKRRGLMLQEAEERERLREATEREERLRREMIAKEERVERDRLRAQREQQEREEKDRLRELREKIESEEREERDRAREKREREEREEKERLREIREAVEREEKEEKDRLRERIEREEKEEMERLRALRERIDREEKEETERLRLLREREEKETLVRKLRREVSDDDDATMMSVMSVQDQSSPPLQSKLRARPPRDEEFQLTPEMQAMADDHRRRTGKELPRVLYRLVPHRSKFRRANELFESNIHADQLAVATAVGEDDETIHSVTSESIRNYLSKQKSEQLSSSQLPPSSSPFSSMKQHSAPHLLSHQLSLPLPTNASGVTATATVTAPIVLPRQSRFSCSNPLHQTKDDFWIDPTGAQLSHLSESSPTSSSSTPKATNPLMDAYDNLKSYLRKKSIFSDPFASSEETIDHPSSSIASLSILQPLPPMNLDHLSSSSPSAAQRRPKRGSKDDLEIERITTLKSISAAHLRQVNLSAAGHHRHPKKVDESAR
jgi:hypothetical protein